MQQTIMPLIPSGATEINEKVCFFVESSMVHYSIFGVPMFEHHENDHIGIKIAIGMLVSKGYCRNCEILKHFAFDALMGYGTRELSGLETVVNPNWRAVDSKVNSVRSKYNNRLSKFAVMELNPEDDDEKREKQIKDKAALLEELNSTETVYPGTEMKLLYNMVGDFTDH